MSALCSLFPTGETVPRKTDPLSAAGWWSRGGVMQSKLKSLSYPSKWVLLGLCCGGGGASASALGSEIHTVVSCLWRGASWSSCEGGWSRE